MSKGPSQVKAELKSKDGRVIGKASQPNETEGNFHSGFDVRFDVALLAAGESLPAAKKPGPAANVKPTVTGVFKGNGKEAKLAYVSAHWREPFDGKPGIALVFTEKDHSKNPKPDFDAGFGKFGNALIIAVFEDGNIFSCQVVHSAHAKKGFSSVGQIRTNNFKFEEGKVEGELVTDGQLEFFGDTWEVNLKFVAPLGEIPKEFQVPDSKKPEEKATNKKQTTDDTADDDSEKPASKPAKDQLNVKALALTKDATDVEYKAGVEHVHFKSKSNTKAVCAELTANLKAQGWTTEGSDLITPASSILKRKRGDADADDFREAGGRRERGEDLHRRPRLGLKRRGAGCQPALLGSLPRRFCGVGTRCDQLRSASRLNRAALAACAPRKDRTPIPLSVRY